MRPEIRKLQMYVLLAVIFLIVSLMFASTAKEPGPKIFNEPPVASFTYEPTNPVASQTITFDASSSYDLDGTISDYAWVGEGLPDDGRVIRYAYPSAGTYVVTLTVWDDKGAWDSKSETISVGEAWYDWPMFHHNPQHTGEATANGIFTVPANLRWTFDTRTHPQGDPAGKIWASPVVAEDGTIYTVSTSSNGGKLYALDPAGNLIWSWPCPTSAQIDSTSAISPEVTTYTPPTRIYVGTHETAGPNFFAINPTNGAVIWQLQIPGAIMASSSLAVVRDPFLPGNPPAIYVGTTTGELHKIVDDGGIGHLEWSIPLSIPSSLGFPSSPALSHDNTIVYVGICNPTDMLGYLVAVNSVGIERWRIMLSTPTPIEWVFSPSVAMVDGVETIFAGTFDRRMRAVVDVAGSPVMKMDYYHPPGGAIASCPAIYDLDGDGRVEVVFGSADWNVYAITYDPAFPWIDQCPGPSECYRCEEYWIFTTNDVVVSSAAIALAPQLTVFIGSNDNRIYSINWEEATWPPPWGTGTWGVGYFDTNDDIISSPAVAQPTLLGVPGWVFVGSNDGKLYAFGPDSTSPATVTDLATSASTTNSITLTWTAPGDDGNTGTASEYDIRYSTSPITEANWNAATQRIGEPAPQPAGSSETFTFTRLFSGTTYYFALKTADEVSNWSPLSNVASGTTLPKLSPIPIPIPPPIS